MARGADGWAHSVPPSGRHSPGTLLWWTFSTERPNGHTGIEYGGQFVVHAGSRGVVKVKLSGSLKRDLSHRGWLRIMVGENG